jgi:hypothetical protein
LCPGVFSPANADETKEVAMRQRFTWLVLFSAAIAVTVLSYSAHVWATPATGFKATTIATGTFGEIDAFNQSSKNEHPAGFDGDVWLSLQKTKGRSDLYVQSNVWPAVNPTTGVVASTGWHTHPGHSLIIVTSGSITDYMADCIPHVYTFVQGQPAPTLVDPGSGHLHITSHPEARCDAVNFRLADHSPATSALPALMLFLAAARRASLK